MPYMLSHGNAGVSDILTILIEMVDLQGGKNSEMAENVWEIAWIACLANCPVWAERAQREFTDLLQVLTRQTEIVSEVGVAGSEASGSGQVRTEKVRYGTAHDRAVAPAPHIVTNGDSTYPKKKAASSK